MLKEVADKLTFLDSLGVTVVSMVIVFVVLAILAFILSLFKYIPKEKETITPTKSVKKEVSSNSGAERFDPAKINSEEMRVAMMVASIEAAAADKNANIRVIGIKELN